jgi:hypothetical protein
MMITCCESHDGCLVVYESHISCPMCNELEELEDQLSEAKDTITELEYQND